MVRTYCWRHHILWLQDKNQAGTELDTQLYRAERCYAHYWESYQSPSNCGSCILQYCQASCIHLYNSGMTVIGVIDYFLNWICGSFHQRKFTFVRNNFVKIPVGREVSMLSEGKPITAVSLTRHIVTLFSFMFTSSD